MRVYGSKSLLWAVEVLHAARFMGISAHAVNHHLSDIFERVGCGNRPELTVRSFHEQDKGLYLPWGIVACTLFLRYRNLYAVGLVHGILGLCAAISVPDAVTHHMTVGLGYLRYHH